MISEYRNTDLAQDNLEMVSDDENVLKKVITGDESWVYGYDPETKRQSSQWKRPDEPRPKKARQSRSHVKSMLIIFFRLWGCCALRICSKKSDDQQRILR